MAASASFLTGESLDQAIRKITTSAKARCAVAFLGRGASTIFTNAEKAQIICNLASGSTNPAAVRELQRQGHEVKQNDKLHAKVYLGSGEALVASANLSANGLAFQDSELAYWIEAGNYITDVGAAEAWFENLLAASRPINEAHLIAAQKLWEYRRVVRPTASFIDFDVLAEDVPIVMWWEHISSAINEKLQADAIGFNPKGFEDYYPVEDRGDVEYLTPGKWMVWWKRNQNGSPSVNQTITWFQAGSKTVDNFVRIPEDGDLFPAIIGQTGQNPIPFDCATPAFLAAFREVIMLKEFSSLRDNDYKGAFLTPLRVNKMKEFWVALQRVYRNNEITIL